MHPIYPPEKRYPAPWEVDIAFLPNYLTKINSELDGLLYVDTNMEQSAESSGRKSASATPLCFNIEDGGTLNYFIDSSTRHLTDTRREVVNGQVGFSGWI